MTSFLKGVLDLWTKEKAKIDDDLYNLTVQIVDMFIQERKTNALQNLPEEYLIEINKFFFMSYDRVAKKLDKTTKPIKYLPIHQELMAKGKIGMLHRTLFTTKKEKKKDDAEDKN